ncbi:MAG TPA: NDP-sugar synthase [Thermoanaerobaculia bacterium]|nr:NDP-sugar synthase [Thermoanaerobaculia bacterium]
MRVRALVLAAGFGTRLRPLSAVLPKPLLPVLGRPLLAHSLERLRALRAEATAVNLHHLGDHVEEAFGDAYEGMPLRYSHEERLGPEPLGTAGALVPLCDFLRDADAAIVINGDSLCRWPLRALLRRHRRSGADATLLLARRADPNRFGGGVGVGRDGFLVDFRPPSAGEDRAQERLVFAGAHVLSARLLEHVAELRAPSDLVRDVYEPMLRGGARFAALRSSTPWHDLGIPARYLDALVEWARSPWLRRWRVGKPRRSFRAKDAQIGARVRLRSAAIESGAVIGAGSSLEQSLVFPGARVGERCLVRRSIVGPGVVLPDGAAVEARLVTVQQTRQSPGPADSVLGDLVFTPIGG